MTKILCLLVLILSAGTPSAEAGVLYGVVTRPPAQRAPEPTINRYRRSGTEARAMRQVDRCNCNPGLYSVVWLTGDSLGHGLSDRSIPTMAQEGKRFVPAVLAVDVGTTVEFPNLDPFFHNVFSYSKTKRFDLGRYPKGESEQVTFDRPGIVNIFCEIHASMRAYVHVLATPYHAVSDEQGRFVVENVPGGDYDLTVWQEGLPELTRRITVSGDSTYVEMGP